MLLLEHAGYTVLSDTSKLLHAKTKADGCPPELVVLLLDVPRLLAKSIQDAMVTLPRNLQDVKDVLIMAPTDSVAHDARVLLFGSARAVDGKRLQLLTAVDAAQALLSGAVQDNTRRLLSIDRRQAVNRNDPFNLKDPVNEQVCSGCLSLCP